MDEKDIMLKLGVGGLLFIMSVREGISFIKWSIMQKAKNDGKADEAPKKPTYNSHVENAERDHEDLKEKVNDTLVLLRTLLTLVQELHSMHDVRDPDGKFVWYVNQRICDNMITELRNVIGRIERLERVHDE